MSAPRVAAKAGGPPVLLLNPTALAQAQAAARDSDPSIQRALAALRQHADLALQDGPFAVTSKQVAPAGGDVHDYVSLSIYWWPDPTSPSGLPYIQRDGVRNPEADDTSRYDANPATKLVDDVEVLSLAYFLTGDETYARHASDMLRVWFLDPATRMNPNFRFAQIIPGKDAVRGTGIIESRRFARVVDSVALLSGCSCWSPTDQDGMQAWFGDFEQWLQTSPNGQLESRTTNNHAVWYDVQLLDFALFAGDTAAATRVASAAGPKRIATQIMADGSMPQELSRTRSLHYSNFNLQAFFELATLTQVTSVDLFNFVAPDSGASIRGALDYLIPYMTDPQSWSGQEIGKVDQFQENGQTLSRAAETYPTGTYQAILDQLSVERPPLDLLLLSLGYWPD